MTDQTNLPVGSTARLLPLSPGLRRLHCCRLRDTLTSSTRPDWSTRERLFTGGAAKSR